MGWSSSRIWWIRAARAARSGGALAAMAAGEEGGDEVACFSIVRFGGRARLRRCDGLGEPVVRGEPLRFCDVSTHVLSVEALRRVTIVATIATPSAPGIRHATAQTRPPTTAIASRSHRRGVSLAAKSATRVRTGAKDRTAARKTRSGTAN